MDQLIAFFNNLSNFFSSTVYKGAFLYPNNSIPRNPGILLHTSLSAFGFIPGGEATVVAALQGLTNKTDGPGMTLMFCAHSDEEPFDFRTTSCLKMGRIPEYVRKMAGTHRSKHPLLSFCASGPGAAALVKKHRFSSGLGPDSPLGKLYKEDGLIFMLGTDWETCTALHLTEYMKSQPEMLTCSAAVVEKRGPFSRIRTHTALDIAYNTERFPEMGRRFEAEYPQCILSGELPQGKWKLMRIRDLVDKCSLLR